MTFFLSQHLDLHGFPGCWCQKHVACAGCARCTWEKFPSVLWCATHESSEAVAYERISTRFATCNTSLSGISIAVICDLTVATVRLTAATIFFSGKQYEHCGVSPPVTTTKNDALLNRGGLLSANLVWYPRVFGLIGAGNTVLSLTYCWWTMSINMRKLFADGAQCSLVCMALCDLSLIQIAPRRYHLIHLDLDSLKARIGWPSPNVTRAPLVGDSQYLHRILLAPKQKNKLYWHCLPKRKPDLSSKLECSCTSSGNRCRISKRFLLPAEVPGGSESIDEEIRVLKSLLPCIIPCCTSFAMTRNPSSWLWSWKLHARGAIHSDWLSNSASP